MPAPKETREQYHRRVIREKRQQGANLLGRSTAGMHLPTKNKNQNKGGIVGVISRLGQLNRE